MSFLGGFVWGGLVGQVCLVDTWTWLACQSDSAGLISIANSPDPLSHLDGYYTIFGEVVTGLQVRRWLFPASPAPQQKFPGHSMSPTPPHTSQVVKAINALATGKPDNTATADDGAFIIDSGQLRRGLPVTERQLKGKRRRRLR